MWKVLDQYLGLFALFVCFLAVMFVLQMDHFFGMMCSPQNKPNSKVSPLQYAQTCRMKSLRESFYRFHPPEKHLPWNHLLIPFATRLDYKAETNLLKFISKFIYTKSASLVSPFSPARHTYKHAHIHTPSSSKSFAHHFPIHLIDFPVLWLFRFCCSEDKIITPPSARPSPCHTVIFHPRENHVRCSLAGWGMMWFSV